MVTTEEEPIIMGGGPLSEHEVDALVASIDQQQVALKQCYSDYLYWREHHATVYYGIRKRRTKAWRYLAQRRLMQSITENA